MTLATLSADLIVGVSFRDRFSVLREVKRDSRAAGTAVLAYSATALLPERKKDTQEAVSEQSGRVVSLSA